MSFGAQILISLIDRVEQAEQRATAGEQFNPDALDALESVITKINSPSPDRFSAFFCVSLKYPLTQTEYNATKATMIGKPDRQARKAIRH